MRQRLNAPFCVQSEVVSNSAMEREKAPIGVFVTAAPPTGAMLREAAAVGRFTDEFERG